MSAPCSSGRQRYGVANVLSTMSGAPCPCATAATASRSSTLPPGLPIVSPKSAFVSGRSAPRQASSESPSTNVTSKPSFRCRCFQLRDRAAVERSLGDDMVARFEQCEERPRLCGEPARERDGANSTLERGDALFERRRRRVHDSRVGVAVFLQVEVGRCRLRVLEDVARRLEDRNRAGAGVRVRPLPGVHLPGVEPPLALLAHGADVT